MNKKLFAVLIGLSVHAFLVYSQGKFEKGFIVTLKGDTINGLIRNHDRVKNPGSVTIRLTKRSASEIYKPGEIRRFMVGTDLYVSARISLPVKIPASGVVPAEKKIDWVFLRAIVEGKKSLYFYANAEAASNYYITPDSSYTLLNYRESETFTEEGTKSVGKDSRYKGQLMLYLQDCPKLADRYKNLVYSEKQLHKLFEDYYICTSDMTYSRQKRKARFQLGALGGVALTHVEFKPVNALHRVAPVANGDLSTSYLPVYGGFMEFIFPKNHGKWSVFAEGIYSSIRLEGDYNRASIPGVNYTLYHSTVSLDQASVNAAVRYRYNLGMVKIFANIGMSFALKISSESVTKSALYLAGSKYIDNPDTEAIPMKRDEQGIFAGFGIKFALLSAEIRYKIGNGFSDYGSDVSSESRTNQLSFLLGFRIL